MRTASIEQRIEIIRRSVTRFARLSSIFEK